TELYKEGKDTVEAVLNFWEKNYFDQLTNKSTNSYENLKYDPENSLSNLPPLPPIKHKENEESGDPIWKYYTKCIPTENPKVAKFWSCFSRPSKTKPLPRGTGGVFFTFNEDGVLEYQFEHHRLVHTLKLPPINSVSTTRFESELGKCQPPPPEIHEKKINEDKTKINNEKITNISLDDGDLDKIELSKIKNSNITSSSLGAPSKRIPELIESKIKVSDLIFNGMLLAERNSGGANVRGSSIENCRNSEYMQNGNTTVNLDDLDDILPADYYSSEELMSRVQLEKFFAKEELLSPFGISHNNAECHLNFLTSEEGVKLKNSRCIEDVLKDYNNIILPESQNSALKVQENETWKEDVIVTKIQEGDLAANVEENDNMDKQSSAPPSEDMEKASSDDANNGDNAEVATTQLEIVNSELSAIMENANDFPEDKKTTDVMLEYDYKGNSMYEIENDPGFFSHTPRDLLSRQHSEQKIYEELNNFAATSSNSLINEKTISRVNSAPRSSLKGSRPASVNSLNGSQRSVSFYNNSLEKESNEVNSAARISDCEPNAVTHTLEDASNIHVGEDETETITSADHNTQVEINISNSKDDVAAVLNAQFSSQTSLHATQFLGAVGETEVSLIAEAELVGEVEHSEVPGKVMSSSTHSFAALSSDTPLEKEEDPSTSSATPNRHSILQLTDDSTESNIAEVTSNQQDLKETSYSSSDIKEHSQVISNNHAEEKKESLSEFNDNANNDQTVKEVEAELSPSSRPSSSPKSLKDCAAFDNYSSSENGEEIAYSKISSAKKSVAFSIEDQLQQEVVELCSKNGSRSTSA
ncbi:hypothetical protein HK099_002484, partial [Clydaea vesicula]